MICEYVNQLRFVLTRGANETTEITCETQEPENYKQEEQTRVHSRDDSGEYNAQRTQETQGIQ